MNNLSRMLILFLALFGAATLLMGVFNLDYGVENYWDHHGVFFLFFITLFPRLTLLFSSVPFGGFFWWLGFFFAPRLLVAMLATLAYWENNPLLVIFSWLVAFSGEFGEKYVVTERTGAIVFDDQRTVGRGTTIEGEFRHMD